MITFWLTVIAVGIVCLAAGILHIYTSIANKLEYEKAIQKRLKDYVEREI